MPMEHGKPKKLSRREMVETLGTMAGVVLFANCGSASSPTAPGTSAAGTSGGASSTCAVIPSETEGPYGDRLGMISNPAYYRRDIREGRAGLPLTLVLTVVYAASGCSAVNNANVEIWQCDAEGHYSEYSQPGFDGTGQTFLRGVQTTDGNGQVTFTTIYPGWYAGRATHIHVEVFSNGSLIKTTQIAFPDATTAAVYSTGIYASKGQSPTSTASGNVFSDGAQYELATLSGDTTSGFTATLTLGVSA
jgi:protocatechuate 3,4-dioxygenase beta subunit